MPSYVVETVLYSDRPRPPMRDYLDRPNRAEHADARHAIIDFGERVGMHKGSDVTKTEFYNCDPDGTDLFYEVSFADGDKLAIMLTAVYR